MKCHLTRLANLRSYCGSISAVEYDTPLSEKHSEGPGYPFRLPAASVWGVPATPTRTQALLPKVQVQVIIYPSAILKQMYPRCLLIVIDWHSQFAYTAVYCHYYHLCSWIPSVFGAGPPWLNVFNLWWLQCWCYLFIVCLYGTTMTRLLLGTLKFPSTLLTNQPTNACRVLWLLSDNSAWSKVLHVGHKHRWALFAWCKDNRPSQ